MEIFNKLRKQYCIIITKTNIGYVHTLTNAFPQNIFTFPIHKIPLFEQ